MKLFNPSETQSTPISDFKAYHGTSAVIATESMEVYLGGVKDSLNSLKRAFDSSTDKMVSDTLSDRFKLESVVKTLNFPEARFNVVPKPEHFKGLYVDYIVDLQGAIKEVGGVTKEALDKAKIAVAGFINEYSEGSMFTVHGASFFKGYAKVREKHLKVISDYFPKSDTASKAEIGKLLKTFNDIATINASILDIENNFTSKSLEALNRGANELAELVNSLVESNAQSGVLVRNNEAKKELVNVIHVTAELVEFMGYLYSNLMFFESSYKAMSDELLKLKK